MLLDGREGLSLLTKQEAVAAAAFSDRNGRRSKR